MFQAYNSVTINGILNHDFLIRFTSLFFLVGVDHSLLQCKCKHLCIIIPNWKCPWFSYWFLVNIKKAWIILSHLIVFIYFISTCICICLTVICLCLDFKVCFSWIFFPLPRQNSYYFNFNQWSFYLLPQQSYNISIMWLANQKYLIIFSFLKVFAVFPLNTDCQLSKKIIDAVFLVIA